MGKTCSRRAKGAGPSVWDAGPHGLEQRRKPIRILNDGEAPAPFAVERKTARGIMAAMFTHGDLTPTKIVSMFSPRTTARTVLRWANQLRTTGELNDQPRTGRPSKVTDEQLQEIRNVCKRSSPQSATEALAEARVHGLSPSTAVRATRKAGARFKRKKDSLSDLQRRQRVRFCTDILNQARTKKKTLFGKTPGSQIIFSDSKYFVCGPGKNGKVRVWVVEEEEEDDDEAGGVPEPEGIDHESAIKSFNAHAYALLCHKGASGLLYVTGTSKGKDTPSRRFKRFKVDGKPTSAKGLNNHEYRARVLPFLQEEAERILGKKFKRSVFMQDGARPHGLAGKKSYMAKETRKRLNSLFQKRWIDNWPAKSPDLNLIENYWANAQRILEKWLNNGERPQSAEQWEHMVDRAWAEATADKDAICRACLAWPNRMKECLKVKGGRLKH